MAVWQFDDGEAHSHNEIPVFQIPMQWLEPGDLARYHQRFTLPLEILGLRVPASPPSPARPALGQPLRLNLTNSVRNPSPPVRFARSKKDFRGWLQEHGLGFVPVPRLYLPPPLEAQYNRIIHFAVSRNRVLPLLAFR